MKKERNTYSWCEEARRYTLDKPAETKLTPKKKPSKKEAK
tara:strand:+ start:1056 stop:1175 length:120 start_codon:yes stop_codon:yes gene_type:complete